MDKNLLISIIRDQADLRMPSNLVKRELFKKTKIFGKDKNVVIVSGIRRCGKSTFLQEIRKSKNKADFFLNFDDERLINFSVEDFQMLYEVFLELFGEQNTFFFDEIQNIKGWERFVRRLHDYGFKVFITGSNASMLSKELGTRLTGRYVQVSLFPFSFREFLEFKKINPKSFVFSETKSRARAKRLFSEFFETGGFPEFIKFRNEEYLKSLYEGIIYRDVLVRNKVANEKVLKELVFFVASNVGKEISFNSLKKLLGLGSSTTVKDYFEFLEQSYLLFLVPKFDFSLKKQIFSNKKIYFCDLALARVVGFRPSSDNGRLLENLVFIELKRRGKTVFYFKGDGECDFLVRENSNFSQAIQVTVSLKDPKTRQRELKGLLEGMKKYKIHDGLILTEDEEESINFQNKVIKVLPVWKWLLV